MAKKSSDSIAKGSTPARNEATSYADGKAQQQGGSADENVALKSGMYIAPAGMFNEVTGYPPPCGEYGPHKGVGEQPFPVDRPSDQADAYGGVLIRREMKGKMPGVKGH